jgi:hypothetical protein
MTRVFPLVLMVVGLVAVFALSRHPGPAADAPAKADKAPDPRPAEGLFDGKLRERVVLNLLRHRAVAQMQRDGFKQAGGANKPLTKAEAEALYDELADDVVLGLVKESSPKTWGAVRGGGFLSRLVEWIRTHPEEIQAIVKLILSLLMVFADG